MAKSDFTSGAANGAEASLGDITYVYNSSSNRWDVKAATPPLTPGIIADFAVVGGGGSSSNYGAGAKGGGAGGMVWYTNSAGTNGSSTNTSLRPYRGSPDDVLEVGEYSLTVGAAGGGNTTLVFPSGAQIIAIGGGNAPTTATVGNPGGSGSGGGFGAGGSATAVGTRDYDGTTNTNLQGYDGGSGQHFSGVAAASAGGGAGGNAAPSTGADGTYVTPAAGAGIVIGGTEFAAGASPQESGTNYDVPTTAGSSDRTGGVIFNHTTNGLTVIQTSGTFTLNSDGTIT